MAARPPAVAAVTTEDSLAAKSSLVAAPAYTDLHTLPSHMVSMKNYEFVSLLHAEYQSKGRHGLAAIRHALSRALDLSVSDPEDHVGNDGLLDVLCVAVDFAASRSFSALQLKAFLQLFLDTYGDVTWLSNEAGLAGVTENLAERLGKKCRRRTVKIWDVETVEETVMEPAPEPVDVKKTAAAKKAPAEPRPLVPTIVKKEQWITRDAEVGPIFAFHDAAAITRFVAETLLQHWRLYRLAATTARRVSTRTVCLGVEEPPLGLPPLQDFLTTDAAEKRDERAAVFVAYETAAIAAYSVWTDGVDGLVESYTATTAVAAAEDAERRRKDNEMAMDVAEVNHVVKAMQNRITKKVVPVGGGTAGGASQADGSSAVPAAQPVAPLEELEMRVGALEHAVHRKVDGPSSPPEKGKKR